jgi:signal transduction histidine kinase
MLLLVQDTPAQLERWHHGMPSVADTLDQPIARLHGSRVAAYGVLLQLTAWGTFAAEGTEHQFRCDLWAARSLIEAVAISVMTVLHVVLFSFHVASTNGNGAVLAALLPYDGVALLLCCALLWYLARHRGIAVRWRAAAVVALPHTLLETNAPPSPQGGSAAAASNDVTARGEPCGHATCAATAAADTRALSYVATGWHAWHVAGLAVLTACRILVIACVACTNTDASAQVPACRAAQIGSLPLSPVLMCTVVLTAFALFLAETEVLAYAVISIAYALVFAGDFALGYGLGGQPVASAVTTYAMLSAAAVALLCGATRYIVRGNRALFGALVALDVREAEREQAHRRERAADAAVARVRETEVQLATWRAVHQATAAYAAHQLKNPLHQASALMADLAAHARLPPDAHTEIQAAREAIRRMDVVATDMLHHQRVLGHSLLVVPSAVDVRELVHELATSYMRGPHAVDVHLEPSTERLAPVWCDAARVRQILELGLTAAVDAATRAAGHVSVRVMWTTCSENTNGVLCVPQQRGASAQRPYIRVEVRNDPSTFAGLDAAAQYFMHSLAVADADPERLFADARAPLAIGGLGLAIAALLARQLRAHIVVYDEPALGRNITVFALEVPHVQPPADAEVLLSGGVAAAWASEGGPSAAVASARRMAVVGEVAAAPSHVALTAVGGQSSAIPYAAWDAGEDTQGGAGEPQQSAGQRLQDQLAALRLGWCGTYRRHRQPLRQRRAGWHLGCACWQSMTIPSIAACSRASCCGLAAACGRAPMATKLLQR